MELSISRQIRKNIFDGIEIEDLYYGGRLTDTDFLSRLYDLNSLPSFDNRFENAAGDIWQHCENNLDWEKNWVFYDPRFRLLDCSDEGFLNFLCEMIHPVVRPETEDVSKLLLHFNDQLRQCNWQLEAVEKIAGRARYEAREQSGFHSQIDRAQVAANVLSSNWMQTEIRRIQAAIESDPALAIGTAKDLVESCCKAILQAHNVEVGKSDDLPTLSKKMSKALSLVPEGIPDSAKGSDIIKRTLSNLSQITKGIAELRGLYGSGHGRDGEHTGLEPRHARLVASCAIAFVDFATETHLKRKDR